MKVSGGAEGTISELVHSTGFENLGSWAYNHAGTCAFEDGWKKGTLEMLEQRKRGGERVRLSCENGIFRVMVGGRETGGGESEP